MDHLDALNENKKPLPRKGGRRLIDRVMLAVHHACDTDRLDVARSLLEVAEVIVKRGGNQIDCRKAQEALVAAHERLWELQRPAYAA